MYEPLLDEIDALTVWDAADAFVMADTPERLVTQWFMPGGHYSRSGNAIVAEWLGSELAKLRRNAQHGGQGVRERHEGE